MKTWLLKQDGANEIRVAHGLWPMYARNGTFQDDGRGIEPENIKRIFEPGFSTKKRGWGLGLSLAKRINEEYHNGKIRVSKSIPNQGTTMEIALKTINLNEL